MGYLSNNGKPAHPYVAGDYSIVAQDRLGKTVFSELVNIALAADLLMTQTRGALSRSMRVPSTYNLDLILESGFYAWSNQATSGIPAGTLSADSFALEVLSSPDGAGLVFQSLTDMTNGPTTAYYSFLRQSLDGGATWSAWWRNTTVAAALGANWLTALAAGLGARWPAIFAAVGPRVVVKTSGALGALVVTTDTEYILSNATTATLPTNAIAVEGQRITFKNKGIFNTVISAAAGQTIGTTSSTSFSLYSQEDYVTLEYDGTSIWYVVATNGPVIISNQSGTITTSTTGSWAAMANGMSLGTLQPGVYDLEIDITTQMSSGTTGSVFVSIGNVLTPIASRVGALDGSTVNNDRIPLHACIKGYVLTSAAVIQGIYLAGYAGTTLPKDNSIGSISARRIG
jgi:hypothetical protein